MRFSIRKFFSRRNRNKNVRRQALIGTQERPRLAINRSHYHIYGQLINDLTGETILSVSTLSLKIHVLFHKSREYYLEYLVGKELARLSLEQNITKIVFDRRSEKYHGKIAALADGLRDGGLKF